MIEKLLELEKNLVLTGKNFRESLNELIIDIIKDDVTRVDRNEYLNDLNHLSNVLDTVMKSTKKYTNLL